MRCLAIFLLIVFSSSWAFNLFGNSVPELDEATMSALSVGEQGCVQDIPSNTHSKDLFASAVRAGYWICAKQFIKHSPKESVTGLKDLFDMEQRLIIKEMSDIKTEIDSNMPQQKITPAFQWCQSTDFIYINIKFSHKLDAPATLNVEASSITIGKQSLHVEASNGGQKTFLLDLPLFDTVKESESTYEYGSVGRMIFTLKKTNTPSKWPRLVPKNYNYQAKLGKSVLHFWHEMHEKYSEELDLMDDEDDDEDDKRRKQKERKKIRDKREKQEREEKEAEEKKRKEEKEKETESINDGDNKDGAGDDTVTETPFQHAERKAREAETLQVEQAAEERRLKEAEEKKAKEDDKASMLDYLRLKREKEIRAVENDGKSKKRDIDFESISNKKKVDASMLEQKKIIEKDYLDKKTIVDNGGKIEMPGKEEDKDTKQEL